MAHAQNACSLHYVRSKIIMEMKMAQTKETHQSVSRALKLLLAFAPYNKPMSAKILSEIFDLHLSTASRLLKVLLENNFLQMDPQTREYTLGKSVLELNNALIHSLRSQIIVAAKPLVDTFSAELNDTVSLEVLAGDHTVLAYSVSGSSLIKISFSVGSSLPMHVAAGAKSILAFSDENNINRILDNPLEKFTDNTITDPDRLRQQLQEIRDSGIAFDHEERDENVQAVAAPIFDFSRKPVAALVIAALPSRMEEHIEAGVLDQLKSHAMEISTKLLYSRD